MTTQITQTGALDLTLSGTRAPVIDYPSNLGNHFVEVRITDDLSILVTSAADAQELKTRFAAAEFYLTDEPLLAPPVHGDEPVCGVRGPEGRFRCACHPGHPGDHVAWGSEAGNGRPFTWPQPFDEFHEYPLPPGDLDDAGDDITDALVAHSEVAHELGECDCPDTAQPGLDVTHSINTRGRQMRRADGSSAPMWFGYCSCGWEGPSRISRTSAIKDANEHPADDPRIVVPDVAQPADLPHVEPTVVTS